MRRLRAAGAVVLGKTAVPELTIWPFTETVTFGATRNPWDTATRLAVVAAEVGRRWPPAWRRWRSDPTAPARSGSRRRGAVCSASNRSATECRSHRMTAPGMA